MKLYVLYDVVQDKLIAEMESSIGSNMVLGAINPETDGNFFKKIIISGVLGKKDAMMGLEKWWKWAIESKDVWVSEEFPFNYKNVVFKELIIK